VRCTHRIGAAETHGRDNIGFRVAMTADDAGAARGGSNV